MQKHNRTSLGKPLWKVRNLRTFSRSLQGFWNKSPEKKSGIEVRIFRVFSRRKVRNIISAFEREKGKRQNSIKRPPKNTKFEPRPLNTTKKLFPKDLSKQIKPSQLEKKDLG
jgi:hypothetical protein